MEFKKKELEEVVKVLLKDEKRKGHIHGRIIDFINKVEILYGVKQ